MAGTKKTGDPACRLLPCCLYPAAHNQSHCVQQQEDNAHHLVSSGRLDIAQHGDYLFNWFRIKFPDRYLVPMGHYNHNSLGGNET